MKKRIFSILLVVFSSAAFADTITVSATGPSVSLQMTLLVSSPYFLATSMSGTLNGQALGALLPCSAVCVSPSGAFVYDNMFSTPYPNGQWYLDENGLGFLLGDGVTEANLFYGAFFTSIPSWNLSIGNRGHMQFVELTNVSAEYTPSTVPEPSTLLLLGTGLLGMWRVRPTR